MTGELITAAGVRVRVRPAPADGSVILSLRVDHPASVGSITVNDGEPHQVQYAETVLTVADLRGVIDLLAEADQ